MSAGRILVIVAVLVAGALSASGAWFFMPMLGREAQETAQSKANAPVQSRTPTAAKSEPATKPDKAKDASDLGFDVVRVGPKEASVFAGRAPPNAAVSITANGEPVTTAKANEDGEWVALPDTNFRAGDYDITLEARVARDDRGTETTSRSYKLTVPPVAVAAAATERASDAGREPVSPDRPTPIGFVYDEATFTSEGEAAAAALADHVKAHGFAFLELSGHADERGSHEHNVALSRRRAEAVAQYLRRSGYKGQLALTAAGATQPYAGIDRRALPQERVYQYDRRVELRLAR